MVVIIKDQSGHDILLVGDEGSATSIVSTAPAGASNWSVGATIQVTPAAGVYASGTACGRLDASFALPPPPGVSCSGSGPNCAAGCTSYDPGDGGVGPCVPALRGDSYSAQGPDDCSGNTRSPFGDWSVTLTSAAPASAGNFVTHGSVTGTLIHQGSGDTATIALTF
jgi:hypothetical protein